MQPPTLRWLPPFALALLMPAAFAQGMSAMATPAPMAATPAATSLQFNSTFSGYRVYTDQPVGSWREANDNVGRIGGWRAYAKEAAQAEGAPKDGAMPGHQHHHGSMGGKP